MLGAASELAALSVGGGSLLPFLLWAVVWLASAGTLGWRLLQASERAGRAKGLKELAEALPVGIAFYDGEGKLSHCNGAMRQAVPDPAALGNADDNLELSNQQQLRFHRGNLAGGERIAAAIGTPPGGMSPEAGSAESNRSGLYLSAAADWIWETDMLHRFSKVAAVGGEGNVGEFAWMIGRSLAELAVGGADRDAEEAGACQRDMEGRERLRDIRLTLCEGGRARPICLSGVPRYDDAGVMLGYCGIGKWEDQTRDRGGMARPVERDTDRPLLLVDDSATNRRLATAILKKMGYEVTAVESGLQAVEEASRGGYAAVLMDIWMPDMDGFEATAAIRDLPAPQCEVPVIAMTAHTGPEERRKCLDAGMDEHVGKPIDRVVLARILGKLAGPPAQRGRAGETAVEETPKSDRVDLVNDEVLEQLRNDAGPALVAELIGAYMAETDERLGRIDSALKAGALEEIGADSHSMKSSSGTFGAIPLQALAARLESAAMRGDINGVAVIHEELPGLVSETWAAFAARGIRGE